MPKQEELDRALRQSVSRSTLRRNPHLANVNPDPSQCDMMLAPPHKKRIRQSGKPLSNKLETNFGQWLKLMHPGAPIYEQAITFRLANGLRYTPDWVMVDNADVFCYEVKGPRMWDDAVAKVKMAASVYKHFGWILVWKENGVWSSQAVYS